MPFESLEAVAAWAEANGGEAALKAALAQGRFGNNRRSIALAEQWLVDQKRGRNLKRGAEIHAEERGFREREIAAQESAAESAKRALLEAKRAADAAERSARWTLVAGAMAVLAFFFSLISYVRPPH